MKIGKQTWYVTRMRTSRTTVYRPSSVALSIPVKHIRNILCIFPAYTPSFGTFAHAFELVPGVRAFMPPQGLLIVAAYLPKRWQVRFIDENIERAEPSDFAWADVVFRWRHAYSVVSNSRYPSSRQNMRQAHGSWRFCRFKQPRNLPGI